MRRLLAIGDGHLHRALASAFGPAGAVQVTEATSARRALVQALVERPDVVVCAECALQGTTISELRSDLDKLGLDGTHLLCLRDVAAGSLHEALPGGVSECEENELFESVVALLPEPTPAAPRRAVNLIASISRIGEDECSNPPGIANVLEIGSDGIAIESPIALELGQRLALGFFVPRRGGDGQIRISATGGVAEVTDETLFHYEVELHYIDEDSRRALLDFLSQPDPDEDD